MLRFRGFRASLNFSSGKRSGSDYFDDVPTVSMNGAYRMNTESEEFTDNASFYQSNKGIRPSMVALPPTPQPVAPRRSKNKINHSKSTNDLAAADSSATPNVSPSKSVGNVSSNPQGQSSRDQAVPTNVNIQTYTAYKEKKAKKQKKVKKEKDKEKSQKESKKINDSKNAETESKKAEKELKKLEKEQKKLEKKQLDEQRKREKLETQERAKQEKLIKEREKAEAQRIAKEQKIKKEKDKKKSTEKQDKDKTKDTPKSLTNPLAQGPRNYSTNTLESSISKTSAPPPYSETNPELSKKGVVVMRKEARRKEVVKNESDGTGNTSFGKPIANTDSSWDMVSQHRQQINRTVVGGTKLKIVTDSQYVTGRKSVQV